MIRSAACVDSDIILPNGQCIDCPWIGEANLPFPFYSLSLSRVCIYIYIYLKYFIFYAVRIIFIFFIKTLRTGLIVKITRYRFCCCHVGIITNKYVNLRIEVYTSYLQPLFPSMHRPRWDQREKQHQLKSWVIFNNIKKLTSSFFQKTAGKKARASFFICIFGRTSRKTLHQPYISMHVADVPSLSSEPSS